ncbi:unnamed protein product [Symbiodinium natans]|uniref:Uncharacterized protein n=1 Tax=Symbiodinium natans TaxID=878477 RepID=A0A812RH32_9DINO|nr:unnamed protein product [Symbiodinium natans]
MAWKQYDGHGNQRWGRSNWYDDRQWSNWEQAPQTPQREANRRSEDMPSPQGGHQQDLDFPRTFKQSKGYHDSNEVFGLKFPDRIFGSAWASQHGLAGRDIRTLGLHELAYRGWDNFHLRALANGRFTSLIFARSVKEATFFTALQSKIREQKIDLDQIAHEFCKQNNKLDTQSSNDNIRKKKQMDHFVDMLMGTIKSFQLQEAEAAQSRIEALEQQLADERKKRKSDDAQADTRSVPGSSQDLPPAKQHKAAKAKARGFDKQLPVAEPTDFLTAATTFDTEPVARTLASNSPNAITPTAVDKWVKSLPISKDTRSRLERAFKGIQKAVKELPKPDANQLPDKAAAYGLPISLASKAKTTELVKIICSAIALAE